MDRWDDGERENKPNDCLPWPLGRMHVPNMINSELKQAWQETYRTMHIQPHHAHNLVSLIIGVICGLTLTSNAVEGNRNRIDGYPA